jgi:hypothetical protein
MPVVGEILKQTTQVEKVCPSCLVGQMRMVLGEGTQPTQNMWIAAQLGEAAQVGKGSVQIDEEAADGGAVSMHARWPQSGGQVFNLGGEDYL